VPTAVSRIASACTHRAASPAVAAPVRRAASEALEARRLFAGSPLLVEEVPYLDSGTQLRITGSSLDDDISVTYSPSQGGLLVQNGPEWSVLMTDVPYRSVWIDAGDGNDRITLDPDYIFQGVLYGGNGDDVITGGSENDCLYGGAGKDLLNGGNGNDVLVSVGGQADRCVGGGGVDGFWVDSLNDKITDVSAEETFAKAIHRVGTFVTHGRQKAVAGSKQLLGQDLPDPALTTTGYATGYANFAGRPLFSDLGPRQTDIWQGGVGSCSILATLSAVVDLKPEYIRQSVVDLGDGTYGARFTLGGAKVFVRVDADLPIDSEGYMAFAQLGAQDSTWVAVMEKAWAVAAKATASYASIDGGWPDQASLALGLKTRYTMRVAGADALLDMIATELNSGRAVTWSSNANAATYAGLLQLHAYAVEYLEYDGAGNPVALVLRNPWGVDGEVCLDGDDDGCITINAQQALSSMLILVASAV
jgi:hypothetical protein